MTNYSYQIGGSLQTNAKCYVTRKADFQLYNALKKGEFCYVLNSRQMGKSSLLVQTRHRLQQEGFKCTTIDMTRIGSENITPLQWYKGIVTELWRGFNLLGKLNLKTWWRDEEEISLLQRLSNFIEDVLLVEFAEENLVIFIDEIDSILSLDFTTDDLFAFIRFCYNQRAINSAYNRIAFAIFGVATPSDLIADKKRTLFNIGTPIELAGFKLEEARPLAKGLQEKIDNSEAVLREILAWTSGQPFLTQKLCQLMLNLVSEKGNKEAIALPPGTESVWVENAVKSRIIHKWESQDEPEHLRTIRDRIKSHPERAGRLLGIYQQILQGMRVAADDSREQIQLILSGLVVKDGVLLKVKNRIYQEVFNLEWVEKQLGGLRPYSQTFDAWIASQQKDESRLLRGQALKDAQIWAMGKSLSDLDYQFLAASVELDRKEVQNALEAERTKEVEARLQQEQKTARLQRLFLLALSGAFAIASGLGITAFWQYRQATFNERLARISEIKALASSARGLFAAEQKLAALVEAIAAKRRLQKLKNNDQNLEIEVDFILEKAIDGIVEYNTLSGNPAGVPEIDFSPDGEIIATAIADKTVKLWRKDGSLLKTLEGHDGPVIEVAFSPNGETIASSSMDNTIKLWTREGNLLATLRGHNNVIFAVAFAPDGQTLASASADRTLKLWKLDGTLARTIKNDSGLRAVSFSPDGQIIATGNYNHTIKTWNLQGEELATFRGHQNIVSDIVFSPDGQTIASSSLDRTVKLWNLDGREINSLEGHHSEIWNVRFSPDGQLLASASDDNTVKLWDLDGTELATLAGHSSRIRALDFSPDGGSLASGSADTTVKLWRLSHPLLAIFKGHPTQIKKAIFSINGRSLPLLDFEETNQLLQLNPQKLAALKAHKIGLWGFGADREIQLWRRNHSPAWRVPEGIQKIWQVNFSPNGEVIAVISQRNNQMVKLRRLDGSLITTLTGHESIVWQTDFSPDGGTIATASSDGTVKLWQLDGTLLQTFRGHQASVFDVAFSPDGGSIASVSQDETMKVWNSDGSLRSTFRSEAGLHSVDFSPDGRTIAVGSLDKTVQLWDLEGNRLHTLSGHQATPMWVQFSPEGKKLLSGSEDRMAIVWNLEEIARLDALEFACDWVGDYLRNSAEVEEGDRSLCDDRGQR